MSEVDFILCFLFAFHSLKVIPYSISHVLEILTAACRGSLGVHCPNVSSCPSILEIFQRFFRFWISVLRRVNLCIHVYQFPADENSSVFLSNSALVYNWGICLVYHGTSTT